MSEFNIKTVRTLDSEQNNFMFVSYLNPGESCLSRFFSVLGLNLQDPSVQQLFQVIMMQQPTAGSFEEKVKDFVTRQVPGSGIPEGQALRLSVRMHYDIASIPEPVQSEISTENLNQDPNPQ